MLCIIPMASNTWKIPYKTFQNKQSHACSMSYRMHLHLCTGMFQHDHYETGSMWIWHIKAQISTMKKETQIHHVLPHDFSPIYIAFESLILSSGWPLYLDPCFSGQIPWKTSCWMSWASRNSPWWLPGITWRPSWMMMRPPHDDSCCFFAKASS